MLPCLFPPFFLLRKSTHRSQRNVRNYLAVYISSDGYLKLGSMSSAFLDSAVEDMPNNSAACRPSKVPTLVSCSPEVLLGDKVTAASSTWVVGCVATMLMTGKPPFKADTEEKQLEYIYRACGTPRA